MVIDSLSSGAWSVTNPGGNATTAGFPTRVPTITRPDKIPITTGVIALGDGVVPMGFSVNANAQGAFAPLNLLLVPYGVATTNNFNLAVIGWRPTSLNVGTPLWVPVRLCACNVILGNATGVAGSDLGVAQIFATTITMTGGPTFITAGAAPIVPDWFEISPTGNPIGMISIRSFGFPFLEVVYDTNSSATSCNALYCRM